MAKLEKMRSEIKEEFKWDLSLIFKNEEEWQLEFNEVEEEIKKIVDFKGKIKESINELLDLYYYLSRKLEKLYIYAHLLYDSETSNKKSEVLLKKIEKLYQEFGIMSSYIEPELLTYNENELNVSEKYKKEITETFRFKKHTLSEKVEELLSNFSNILSGSSETYDNLTETDLKLGFIKDENNEEVELTDSNYSIYISSKDRRVRKDAFEALYNAYKSVINTTNSTYKQHVELQVQMAKVRNYNSALQASLYRDNIDNSVFYNLVDTVSRNLSPLYRYYDLKKKVLNLDEIHLYDLYVDLIEEEDRFFEFEEAKKLVIESLSILGEEYIKDMNQAFDKRWIDIYANKSKRSGAYSSGGYDTAPYILLNYQGKLDDVSTLAHELGHSMHSYYSKNNNPYHEADYKIFVAEVASTVNELLLCKYLIKNAKDDKMKLSILNRLLDLFKGTIYRQTMFSEFEMLSHELVENNKILTSELLSDKYYELNQKYFGKNVFIDEEIKNEWSRIPHFYYNFYVYKYATGLSAACYIVNNILSNKENALENYLEFLKTGGRDYPIEELKIAGVDMNDPKVVESAINMFENTINEFEQIYFSK